MKILSLILILTLLNSASFAKTKGSESITKTEKNYDDLSTLRLKKRHGLTTGLSELGLPGLSFKYSYQMKKKLRLKLGYSTLVLMQNSKGIGLDYVMNAQKTFTPTIGLNLFQSEVISGKKFMTDLLIKSLTGDKKKLKMETETVHGASINFGLDARTVSGLIFNLGINTYIFKYDGQYSKVNPRPYINVGKAF
ncbi:MAG: hypothetical protein VXY34_01405 [Bdellovibrionota bacterium]|nr:hypothetical protein [Bdellovibrionota bacterium]